MKKLIFVLGLIVFTACKPSAESYIRDMKDLIEDVMEEGSEYTAEQWEAVNREFDELIQKHWKNYNSLVGLQWIMVVMKLTEVVVRMVLIWMKTLISCTCIRRIKHSK